MSRHFFVPLVFLVSTVTVPAAEKTVAVTWNNPVDFTEPGLRHHQFTSDVMRTEVGYSVWLPPGYETSAARYPVIYFLHGSGGTESADAPAFSQMLAAQVAKKSIPPVIAIFPNGGLSGYRDHPDAKGKVESMIVGELLPLIDRTYRTKANRESRTVGGFSMGGGGSVRLALRYPELFSAAASWAGAFFRERREAQLLPEFAQDALMAVSPQPRLLLIVGYDDLTYPAHEPFVEALQAARYPFTLHTIAGLGHELDRYYRLTGDEFISFLTADFAVAP